MNPPTFTRRVINGLYAIQFREPTSEIDGDTRLVGVLVALLCILALTSIFDRMGANYRRSEWVLDGNVGAAARLIRDSDRPDRIRADIVRFDPDAPHQLRLWKRVAVDSGKAYSASFRIRADKPRAVDVMLIQGHLPFHSLADPTAINVTENWEEHRLVFFSSLTDTDVHLAFELGSSDAAIELANVTFAPLEDAKTWRLWVSPPWRARLAARDGKGEHVHVQMERPGTRDLSDIELVRPLGSLVPGRRYRIRFRARADAICHIPVNITASAPPWQNLGLSATIHLTPEWQNMDLRFVATGDGKAKLSFALGLAPSSIEIADMILEEVP